MSGGFFVARAPIRAPVGPGGRDVGHDKQAGRVPSHNSLAQYRASRHVPLAQAQPGDLVFMARSGTSADASKIDHVGVYAGSNAWYVASEPGSTVHRQALWTRSVRVGRP